jgi:hypothetical protein
VGGFLVGVAAGVGEICVLLLGNGGGVAQGIELVLRGFFCDFDV